MAGGSTILHARITLQAQDLIQFCHTLHTGPTYTLIISSSLFDLCISLLQEQRKNIYKRQAEWWLHMKGSVKVFDHFSQQFLLFLSLNEIGKKGPQPLALSPPRFPMHPFIYIFNFFLNSFHARLKASTSPIPPPPNCAELVK